ncbi:hypothetical protein QQ045_005923 [Rhodiola kirilowii]
MAASLGGAVSASVLKDSKLEIQTFQGLRAAGAVQVSRRGNACSVASSAASSIRAVSSPVKPETLVPTKRSKVEIFKEQSNFIRYPLNEDLKTDAPGLSEAATQLIKFHGSYQQTNREERGSKSYSFMLRTKNPCGKVSNQLYLTMDSLADEFGIGTLRLTTRQTFQLHGVLKQDLKTVMSTIIKSMGSTLGACGDLNRNVGLKYNEAVVVRITGCPNGCARPYMAELGLVGDGPNSYQIWLGGTPNQTVLARTFMNKVKIHDLEKIIEPLFYNWKRKRFAKESFGEFTNRLGFEKLQELVDKWEGPETAASQFSLKLFADKNTYEAVDSLAKLQNKTAHQLAMEVVRNYVASQQNGKYE